MFNLFPSQSHLPVALAPALDQELMTVGEQSWIRIASIDAQWQKAPEHIVRMKRQPCDFPYKSHDSS